MSEKVDPDFAAFINRSTSDVLERQLRGGISDQRKAFIQDALARRESGQSPIEARTQALGRFQEQRSVGEARQAKEKAQLQKQQQTKVKELVAVGTGARGGVLVDRKST